MPERRGSEEDVKNICREFKKLNYVLKLYKNLTISSIIQLFKHISRMNHSEMSSIVFFILSHGTSGHIYGTDRKKLEIMKIPPYFSSSNCPSLSGKPKLFFVQACQTVIEEKPNNIMDFEPDGVEDNNLTDMVDILIGYSTVHGQKSFRSRSEGSWYVKKLCLQISQYHDR